MPKESTRVDTVALLGLLADPARADDTDERILGAAAVLLLTGGLTALEVDEVAVRSGIGRSTIYRRFGDRNALITATLAREGRRLLAVLADAVADADDVVEQVVTAFCAGLRMAQATGLADLVREDPRLLRLLTIDGAPVIAAARDELAELARRRDPSLGELEARRTAEVLVRLGISFVIAPESCLDPAGDDAEVVVRRTIGPLVDPRR